MGYKVVFFGNPEIAATVLRYLAMHGVSIVAVVTHPDKPIKRSKEPIAPPVKIEAEKLGLPVYQPAKASSEEFVTFLKTLQADLFIVVAFGEIFKENFLTAPPLGCLNVHASLLPKYRGAAPIQRAIWEGEKESGVSIMKLVNKMDAGAVYKQARVAITPEMTAGDLTDKLAEVGGPALLAVLQEIEAGDARLEMQEESQVTFAKKLFPEDGYIDFSKNAEEIERQIRACTPKPGAWCMITFKGNKKRLLIKRAKVVETTSQERPGCLLDTQGKALRVACGKGVLELVEVQLESKQAMSGSAFLRGAMFEDIKF